MFADTFYFLALLNAGDAGHARAVAMTASLPRPLLTTERVLTELADAMANPANRTECVAFLRILRTYPDIRIVPADSNLFDDGLDLYARRPDKAWSLTECTSFVG